MNHELICTVYQGHRYEVSDDVHTITLYNQDGEKLDVLGPRVTAFQMLIEDIANAEGHPDPEAALDALCDTEWDMAKRDEIERQGEI